MGNNDQDQVASLLPTDGAQPAVAPIGLNKIIDQGVTATDIQTAWKDGKEIGWVYKGSDGHTYWKENYQYGESSSIGASAGVGVDAGVKLSVSGGVSYNFPSGVGPSVRLNKNEAILDQLPQGTQLLRGIDRSKRNALPDEGQTFNGSPVAMGDQIPNKTPNGTTVVDINTIKNSAQQAVGWVYRGADGHNYFQFNTANPGSVSKNWQVGPVAGSVNPAAYSDIHRYRIADLKPGDYLEQGAFPERPTLDRDGGGLNGPGPKIQPSLDHTPAHNPRHGTHPHAFSAKAQGHSQGEHAQRRSPWVDRVLAKASKAIEEGAQRGRQMSQQHAEEYATAVHHLAPIGATQPNNRYGMKLQVAVGDHSYTAKPGTTFDGTISEVTPNTVALSTSKGTYTFDRNALKEYLPKGHDSNEAFKLGHSLSIHVRENYAQLGLDQRAHQARANMQMQQVASRDIGFSR